MPIDGEECFALYHKNTLNRDDGSEEVPGYHRQITKELSLSAYLKYIVGHEVYRMSHSLKYQPRKADQSPPKKEQNDTKSSKSERNASQSEWQSGMCWI